MNACIYKTICDLFKNNQDVFTNLNLPPIRHIDINYGQPDDLENFEVFFPAIFISWSIREPSKNEPNILTLEFHCLQTPGEGTEGFADKLAPGFEYINVLKTIKYMLNGLRAYNTTPLRYVDERPVITPYVRYHVVTYECFIDKVDESFTAGSLTNVELTGYVPEINLKQKTDIPVTVIDTYKKM